MSEEGYVVQRGPIATIEIGIEVKIIQKAMIRQIDRVINDLKGQVQQFKAKKGTPITIGVVGVNRAQAYVSYEGDTQWPTTGVGRHKHPYQEADETISRLGSLAAPHFDEFLILEFIATNSAPFPFTWVNPVKTQRDYGAILELLVFERTFTALANALGDDAWRHLTNNQAKGGFSVYVFDALSIGVARNIGVVDNLSTSELATRCNALKNTQEFKSNVGAGANTRAKIRERLAVATSIIRDEINHDAR